jgi:O-antigen/teichoic acid export membrane protein
MKATDKNNIVLLKGKVVGGMISLVAREIGMKVLSIVGQLLLVHLLTPENFGIFAVLTFIVTTLDFLLDLGLTQGVIQSKQKITQAQFSTIFFLKLSSSCLLFVLFIAFAPFLKLVYPQLTNNYIFMIRVLSIIFLLRPLQSTITSMLDRNLEYKSIARIDILGITTYYVIAIVLSIFNFQVWALIIAIIGKEIVETITAFLVKRWIPSFTFSLGKIGDIIRFGFYSQLGSLLFLLHSSVIPLVGGMRFSPYSLGLLDWSWSIALLPNALSDNFGRVALSGMSRIQEEKELVVKAINKSVGLLNIISYLFPLIVFSFGYEIIFYVFGDKWLPALSALTTFSIGTFFMGGNIAVGHGLLAIGKVKSQTIVFGILTFFEILFAILFSFRFGIVGISYAFVLHAIALFIAYYAIGFNNHMKLSVTLPYLGKFTVVLLTFIFAQIVNSLLPSNIVIFVIKIVFASICYILFSFIFSKEEVKELIHLFVTSKRKL